MPPDRIVPIASVASVAPVAQGEAPLGFEVPQSTVLERVLLLRTFVGFSEMTPEEVGVIAENTTDRFVPAGTEIFAEGLPATSMHYVLEGRVAARRHGETLRVFEAPAVVGALGLLARVADGQQMVAETDCRTLEMGAEVVTDVFEDNFTLLLMVIRATAEQFIQARREAGPNAGFDQTITLADPPENELSLVEKLFYLRQNITFARGAIEVILGLARRSQELRLPAGTPLWKIGDPSGSWLVLISGVIRCENPDQEFRFGPGDSVGGLDSLGAVPRWFDATVESDIVALEIDVELLVDLFEDNVDLAVGLCQRISGFLIQLREENAMARSAELRSRPQDP